MVDGDVRERSGRSYPGNGPVLDLVASKLRRPLARPGTVLRLPLVERLAQSDPRPIVSVVAPSGYGKTTLLAQWAERNGQSFAWVSVDENDNDPKVLLTYVAEALDAVQPVGERVFDALASPASSVPGSVVPRLGTAFASMTTPVALVLDDVHILHNQECRAALSVLADHVPDRSRLVLAGRAEPPLRTGRLRAEGRILEIGPADLSLTREEAAGLLREAGVVLGADEVTELHRRTEGWPTGLYLAALYLREGGSLPGAAAAFGGDDRLVSEYVESEFLARIPEPQRLFLTWTAVLDRMCAPLCEAVLERPGSGADLAGLARSNLLLVPLDRRGQWYRYHHLFREMLLADLERTDPALIPVLRRRAADWCHRNGLPEEALEYSIAAATSVRPAVWWKNLRCPPTAEGRITTLQRWFRWLEDQDGITGHPMVAVWAAILAARTGRPVEAERWADAVERLAARDAGPAREPESRPPGPQCCRPCCAGAAPSRCEPTPTKPRAVSRRQASWRRWSPSCKGLRRSFAVILTALTRRSTTLSASGALVHPMCWRWRCASGRCWPWLTTTGARPRSWPSRHAACCTRAGAKRATSRPWSARRRPAWPCTAATSRRRSSNWSMPSGCDPC